MELPKFEAKREILQKNCKYCLVTPGNPQRCDLMIAKGPLFNCGFVYLESSSSGYHFSCEVLSKISSLPQSLSNK